MAAKHTRDVVAAAGRTGPLEFALVSWLFSDGDTGFAKANDGIPCPMLMRGPRGCGLQAAAPLRAGVHVLRIPSSTWLPFSGDFALAAAYQSAPPLVRAAEGVLGNLRLLQTLCLAVHLQLQVQNRRHHPHARGAENPYPALLADRMAQHPLLLPLVNPGALLPLQASPLGGQLRRRTQYWSSVHASLFGTTANAAAAALSSHGSDESIGVGENGGGSGGGGGSSGGSSSGSGGFTLQALLGGVGVLMSRATTEGPLALVPYLDMLNHGNPANCELSFDTDRSTYVVTALRDCNAGEELLIDYGASRKGVYQFARTYGFGDVSWPNPARSGSAQRPKGSSSAAGRAFVASGSEEQSSAGSTAAAAAAAALPEVGEVVEADARGLSGQAELREPAAGSREGEHNAAAAAATGARPGDFLELQLPKNGLNTEIQDPVWRLPVRFVSDAGGPTEPPARFFAAPPSAGRDGSLSEQNLEQRRKALESVLTAAIESYDTPIESDVRWLASAATETERSSGGGRGGSTSGWERLCRVIVAGEKVELHAALDGVRNYGRKAL